MARIMKTNQKKELFSKTIPELTLQLGKAKEELFSLQLEHGQRKLKNTNLLTSKRKEIAKILTILKQKDLPAGRGFKL